MGKITFKRIFCSFLLLVAAACILYPVVADNGTITIAYRGSGGSTIGDTVVFDGRNTYGNTILLKITGPGLPSQGVPVNNLNGPSGTATSVGVDQYGMWKFVWYASGIPGLDKLQTARYTFIATDSENPAASATTSLLLKKPEFYITVSPNPSYPSPSSQKPFRTGKSSRKRSRFSPARTPPSSRGTMRRLDSLSSQAWANSTSTYSSHA